MGNAQPKPAAAPAAAAAPVQQGRKTDSTDTNPTAGMRVLEPHEVKGDLEDFYDVPESKQQLGRGHYGAVTVCYSKDTGRQCAVKSVAKLKPRHIQMLKNEVAIMRSLDHPSIITLFDVFETDTHVQLVMEMCTGGELFDRIIAEQHFSEDKAAKVVHTLLSAVEYCHRNNVVHRDLKPENFLLVSKDPDSDLKVIDFGLSKKFETGEEMHARVGTPYYIAPEVLDKNYGPECDLWSCGVVLYILLCGYPPFWGDRDQEIFRKVRRGVVSFEGPEWESVTDRAKHLILALLDKDRHNRITASQALQHPWIKSIGGNQDKLITNQMFERLQRFSLFSRMKQFALVFITHLVTPEEMRDSRMVFEKIALGDTGTAGGAELHAALRSSGHTAREDESQRIMDSLDVRAHGFIGLAEFAAGTIKETVYLDSQRVYAAFLVMSTHGHISVDSLTVMLADHLNIDDPEFCRSTAIEMITQVDEEEDDSAPPGTLCFDRFFRVMCAGEKPHS